MATISLKDFGRKLDNIGDCIKDNEWKVVPLKLGEALMKVRIFQKGLASDGSRIGSYRSSHVNARRKKGRQTGYKDLFFNGDLNRALQVGERGNDYVLGLATDKARLIMAGQEKQTGKSVASATNETAKKIAQSAARELQKCIAKNFNK